MGGIASFMKACFVAGTPIRTPEGSKAVELFRAGDLVLSRNEYDADGAVAFKRVLQTFVRISPILNLHVCGRIIGTTAEHPFFVRGKGWVDAHMLRLGDELQTSDGRWLACAGIAYSGRVEAVYNIDVEDDHTYFVGDVTWGWSVWAHNAQYTPTSRRHVYDRGHAANAPPQPGQSRFRVGEGGQKFTDEVINHPNAVVTHQSNGRVRYDVTEMGRITGRNRAGGLTRGGQVIVEGPVPHTSKYAPGEVVTQYPL